MSRHCSIDALFPAQVDNDNDNLERNEMLLVISNV